MKSLTKSCVVCKKETERKCSGCQAVYYCSAEHQKENWKEHKKDCSPLMVIEDDPVFGKQWVAGRDLEAGTLVLTELPILKSVYWPADESQENQYLSKGVCLACGKNLDLKAKVYKCAGCSWPLCSEECEKDPIHADNECKVFEISGFFYPPKERLISPDRIDLAVDIIRATHMKQRDEVSFRKLMNLQQRPTMELPEGVKGVEKQDAYLIKCHFNFNLIGMSDKEVMALPWIRRLNALRFESTEDRCEIHNTYIKGSKFSNSCSPNCCQSVVPQSPDFKLEVRTAVPVRKGEALTISYWSQPFAGTRERQEKMKELFFICKCKRCVDPTELGTYMSAVTCQKCYKEVNDSDWFMDGDMGFLIPEDPLSTDDEALWKCNRCTNTKAASVVTKKINKMEKPIAEKFVSDVLLYDTFIEDNMGKVVHRNHHVILKAVEQLTKCFKEPDNMNLEAHKLHVLHQLTVNDVIFPGLSYLRALYQFDLLVTMKNLAKDEDANKNDDFLQEIKLCARMIKEATRFYKLFKDDAPEGEDRLKKLKEIKSKFAEITE